MLNLLILTKQKSITPQKHGSCDFWQTEVLQAKINLLQLTYLIALKRLFSLIKQKLLLRIFIRALILMNQVSLYLLSLLQLI